MPGKKFRYETMVRESHLDTFGHVNNAAYLQLFEEARWEAGTQNGYGFAGVRETGLGPVVLEIRLKFRRELKLREKLVIETQCHSHQKKIFVLHQNMVNPAGQIACGAEFTMGLFDLAKRKLVPLSDKWLGAIGVM